MATASLFRKVDTLERQTVTFTFEGQTIQAQEGDTVAASLIAAGVRKSRETPVSGEGRAPYCMMGACFECLVEIDGEQNKQSCMIPVSEGMVVKKQRGAAIPQGEGR